MRRIQGACGHCLSCCDDRKFETLVLGNALARARAAEHSAALPSRAVSAVAASSLFEPHYGGMAAAYPAQHPEARPPTRALSSSALLAALPQQGCDLAASQLLLPKAVFGPAADEMLLRPAPLPPLTQPCRPSVAPQDSRVWACRRVAKRQPSLLLPDRYTNIAPEDCIEMLMPSMEEEYAGAGGDRHMMSVPPSPSLRAVPESFAFPAPAHPPAPPSVVAGWADGVARAAAATAAALRAAAARAAAPDKPSPMDAQPTRALPRAAPSQCQGMRRAGPLLRAAATSPSDASDGTSPARHGRPPLAPTPKQQYFMKADEHNASMPMSLSSQQQRQQQQPRRSTSADDIASMVAAIDGASLGKGGRKRVRAATPRAAASCVSLGACGPIAEVPAALPSSASASPEAEAEVEAMLGAAVAAGLGAAVAAGPPAEANAPNGCSAPPPSNSKPQHSASVTWLRAALGMGPT